MATKGKLVFSLLFIIWLASFFLSMISNYKISYLVIKGSVSLLLLGFIYFDYLTGSVRDIVRDNYNSIKKIILVLAAAAAFPGITLLYSLNPAYGTLKLLSLITGTVPCVFGLYYITITMSPGRLKIIIITGLVISLTLAFSAIVLKPFSFAAPYRFTFTNWSHVIFARFISIIFLLILTGHLFLERREYSYAFGFVLLILFAGILISGHKASIIGVILTSLILILYKAYKISWKNRAVYISFSAMVLSVLIVIGLSGYEESARRTAVILEPDKLMMESGVAVRLKLWEKAIEAGNDNIILGTGLGGFNSEKYSGKDLHELKYPHNLPLEIYAELGIVIFLLFLVLAGIVFFRSYKMGFEILLLVIYFFWLSLFSKDIATNTQVWFVLVVIAVDNLTIERVKASFRLLINIP